MKIQDKYKELVQLKKEINKKLSRNGFQEIKELMLWLANSNSYQNLKTKDNQLIALECFCNIWLEEKKQLEQLGIHEDVFNMVTSLEDVERKYSAIKYCALRIENNMPEEYCDWALAELIDYKISGIAMAQIIISETYKRKQNIVELSRYLKERQQLVTAVTLLQQALKTYEKEGDLLLELADCWMIGQQWKQAYEILKQIEKPDEEIQGLIKELEKVI